jgi:D-alanyl-lipoteichoic acid acyltransferase DltB (MBOAT superfamily)
MIYAPLYIAGPILSFNAFMKYEYTPQTKMNSGIYAVRWIINFFVLEMLLSYFPFFAIINSNLLFHLNALEICVVVYLILKMMWLKFLLLWRFFRAWCLFDGVYVEENMARCMSNNYSLEQFWQNWHSTFNQWIVRYLYIPCGGRQYQMISVWIIFAFVALWHDLEWKLFLWGCLNSLFYSIEIFVYKPLRQHRHSSPFNQWLVSCFGALYILILMMVNAIGYAVGTGGISIVMNKLFSEDGIWTLLGSFYFLMIGVNIMFYYESLFVKSSEKPLFKEAKSEEKS